MSQEVPMGEGDSGVRVGEVVDATEEVVEATDNVLCEVGAAVAA